MAHTAPERSNFFARSNYALVEAGEWRAVEKQSGTDATPGLLSLADQALGKLEQGIETHAALRELWAALLELRRLRASDPGVRMAVQDLYEAAAAVSLHKRAGEGVVDLRLWRLMRQAQARLMARLA